MRSLSARARALWLATGIFVIGLACGAMVERWVILGRRPPFPGRFEGRPSGRESLSRSGSPDRLLGRLTMVLELTKAQQDSIRMVLDESGKSTSRILEQVREQMRNTEHAVRIRIQQLLTSDQRLRFEKMESRRRHRARSAPGRSGGRPPAAPP